MRTVVAILTAGFLLIGSLAWAQMPCPGFSMMGAMFGGGGGGGGGGVAPAATTPGPLIGQLLLERQFYNLTPEQVKQLEALQSETQREAQRRATEIQKVERELDALLLANPIDTAKVEDKIKALESLRSDELLSLSRALAKAKGLLTPEQLRKVPQTQAVGPIGAGPTGGLPFGFGPMMGLAMMGGGFGGGFGGQFAGGPVGLGAAAAPAGIARGAG